MGMMMYIPPEPPPPPPDHWSQEKKVKYNNVMAESREKYSNPYKHGSVCQSGGGFSLGMVIGWILGG